MKQSRAADSTGCMRSHPAGSGRIKEMQTAIRPATSTSRPARVRGLKSPLTPDHKGLFPLHHRMGVRGLKLRSSKRRFSQPIVAPRRGAWGEEVSLNRSTKQRLVAPRRGCGLKRAYCHKRGQPILSHPAGVRGLKFCFEHFGLAGRIVAPRKGCVD